MSLSNWIFLKIKATNKQKTMLVTGSVSGSVTGKGSPSTGAIRATHWLDAKFLAKALPGSHRYRSYGALHSITTYHNGVLGKEVARFNKVELRKLL